MGLGLEFTSIRTALNEHNLPPKWHTMDIEDHFRVTTSYLNTVKSIQKQNADYKEDQRKQAQQEEDKNKQNKNDKKQ